MRIKILTALLLFQWVVLSAQNVQMHYDFGSSMYDKLDVRPKLTTTIEMFKPDKWGSNFFFVDMDYTGDGVSAAYWEIVRELKFWNAPVSAHLEYNGGLPYINNAYMLGSTYTYNKADFSNGFSLSAMYKYIQKNSEPNNFQLTGVWYMHFAQRKMSFIGFTDFWREKNAFTGTEFVFLSEPQFWVNLNKFRSVDNDFNLSIGTEWEFSNNFAGKKGFYCIPTLALKWTFAN